MLINFLRKFLNAPKLDEGAKELIEESKRKAMMAMLTKF
jgi:hypothetical protein